MRKIILGLFIALGALVVPAISAAQAPPPVPALPDTERRTLYAITAATGPFDVAFAVYGDGTDYGNWIEVWVNGILLTPITDWTLALTSGTLATVARPLTNAQVTLTAARTGTLQIVGARRPRRAAQFNENQGVSARSLNQALTDVVAQNRETWDKINDVTGRGLFSQPGVTMGRLPLPSSCLNGFLNFGSDGHTPTCVGSPGGGTPGLPGGSNTQVQYNNAGAFGGVVGATSNGSTLTLVAPILGTPASAILTNATGLPLGTGVVGNLPVTNLASGAGASNTTFWRGDGTWAAPGAVGGSVTNVATSAPLTGGPITTTGTINCPTCVTTAAGLTASLPVIGAGGNAVAVGTVSGNTTTFATFSGAATAGRCVQTDISGNLVIAAGACGTSGGTSNPPGGAPGQVQYQVNATTFGGITGATTNGVAMTLAGGLVTADPTLALGVASKQYVDAVGAVANNKVAKAGDTMTGDLSISKASPILGLNKTASGQDITIYGVSNGAVRWGIGPGDGVAEIGGNAGSNFSILAFNDAGSYLSTPLYIYRATGNVSISSTTASTATTAGALTVVGGVGIGGSIYAGSNIFMPAASAGIEIGALATPNTPFVDGHSSGNANDYDARMLFSGGNAFNGGGLITLNGASVTFIAPQASASCVHTPTTSSEVVACSSDRALKRKIADAGSALDKIGAIRVRSYETLATGEKKAFGIVAQELEEVHPEMVHVGDKGIKMAEQPDPWMLLKAIQELKAANDNLKSQIARMRAGGRR
jgi:hypothetical protein